MSLHQLVLAILVAVFVTIPKPAPAAGVSHDRVTLAWTAPGDDGLLPPGSRASQYDVRYSTSAITAANFASATRWTGAPLPGVVGTTDSTTVTGLVPNTTYWFALKAADEVLNWSNISNVISVATAPPPDLTPPGPVTDLRIGP